MIPGAMANLFYPSRAESPSLDSAEDVAAYIESRSLPYPAQLEDDFARRALALGVESGMVLDVGTRVGLIALIMMHIYFGIRPEKRPITKSMISGWMSRDFYLEEHDPQRWVIDTAASSRESKGTEA